MCVCVGVGNVCKGLCVVGRMSRQNGPTFRMDSQHETQCNTNHVIPSSTKNKSYYRPLP